MSNHGYLLPLLIESAVRINSTFLWSFALQIKFGSHSQATVQKLLWHYILIEELLICFWETHQNYDNYSCLEVVLLVAHTLIPPIHSTVISIHASFWNFNGTWMRAQTTSQQCDLHCCNRGMYSSSRQWHFNSLKVWFISFCIIPICHYAVLPCCWLACFISGHSGIFSC